MYSRGPHKGSKYWYRSRIRYWAALLLYAPHPHKLPKYLVHDRCMPPSTLCARAKCTAREYLILYRGPGFLAVVWYGSSPLHLTPPHPSASCPSFSDFLCVAGRAYWQECGGGGRSQIIRRWESIVLHNTFNNLSWYSSMFRPFQAKSKGWPFLFL